MSGISRRDFFKQFTHSVSDQIDIDAARETAKKWLTVESPKKNTAEWFIAARLADLHPGAQVKTNIGNVDLTLKSNPLGIWAETLSGARVALKTGFGGMVLVNPIAAWPHERILLHATGEQSDQESALFDTEREKANE